MISSNRLGRRVSKDVDKALANIGASTPMPDMKDDGAELKAAVAPKKAMTFAEAFRAARKDPEAMKRGTFTYGGKSFSTKMAGEGGKKAAPVTRRTTQQTNTSTNAAPPPPPPPSPPPPPPANKPKPKTQGDTYSSGVGGARSAAAVAARKSGKVKGILDSAFGHWVSQTDRNFQERQKKKYGKAAGGKIDGCAIRGKTRAMRKGK